MNLRHYPGESSVRCIVAMFEDHNAGVVEIFENSSVLSESLLDEIKSIHRETGDSVAELILKSGAVSRHDFFSTVAKGLAYRFVPDLTGKSSCLQLFDAKLAYRYGVYPLREEGSTVVVLAADPFNPHILTDLSFVLKREVEIAVADPDLIWKWIENSYGPEETSSLEEIIAEVASRHQSALLEADASRLGDVANDAPVIRLVELILQQAIRDGASDVHFEPFENSFQVRYRIGGALYEMAPPQKMLALPVISRIKVLADLNIAEQRLPQDGRIKLTIDGRAVDLRVSTLPTEFGESVVLRVLDKSAVNLDLEVLGMPADVLAGVRAVAKRPNGIFIVTGPTGSGKTTTLYSALREVNDEETKILTAEDPVEYEIEGLVQCAVNPGIGFTFASALRSFLRQDPDKILVGEIRDLETARIAVQASLTGHLVMSTLHTNDAPGGVSRLIDMGLEPFMISASLEAILAQRLIRGICPHCREAYTPKERHLQWLDLTTEAINGRPFFAGTGCAHCHRTGYSGRLGLFEWMPMSDVLKEKIIAQVSTPELRRTALLNGMRTLREDGLRAVFEGRTTPEEVLAYT